MNFNDYQRLAERTSGANDGVTFHGPYDWKSAIQEKTPPPDNWEDWVAVAKQARGEKRLTVACLGLCGETGELTDCLKKVVAHGHPLDKAAVAKELGDVLWYAAELASTLGLSLQDVAEKNIRKLQSRYPLGFSHAASVNRKE